MIFSRKFQRAINVKICSFAKTYTQPPDAGCVREGRTNHYNPAPKYSLPIQPLVSNFQLCSAYICKNICINVYYNTSDLLSKSLFLHFMIFCTLKHFYQYYNKFIGYKSATRIIFVSLLVIVF